MLLPEVRIAECGLSGFPAVGNQRHAVDMTGIRTEINLIVPHLSAVESRGNIPGDDTVLIKKDTAEYSLFREAGTPFLS